MQVKSNCWSDERMPERGLFNRRGDNGLAPRLEWRTGPGGSQESGGSQINQRACLEFTCTRGGSMASFLDPLLRKSSENCTLVNSRTGVVLADRLIPAFDSAARRRGLLQHGELPEGSAMIIAPSNAIHTFFMKFPIDVAFVSRDGVVRKIREAVPPWRMSAALRSYAVIEMHAGALRHANTAIGDSLVIRSTGRSALL